MRVYLGVPNEDGQVESVLKLDTSQTDRDDAIEQFTHELNMIYDEQESEDED